MHGVYAAIFIDAIYVKVRDGQVGNQRFYAAIGVDLGGDAKCAAVTVVICQA